MKPIASCKVGHNPIINGRERIHINYHVVIPDKPTRVGMVKFPNLRNEINKTNRAINQIRKITLIALSTRG